ncbi:MAG: hypothetical protein SF187_28910 [Deltaproteobacteria bacterium]|nr:hypothetical protein [Deltaproteobacteria bacterium]
MFRPSFAVPATGVVDPPAAVPDVHVEGAVAAKAFKLFEEGASPREAVINLSLAPAQAVALWASYKSLGPEWVLPPKSFARVRRLLDWNDEPATPESFERALRNHIARQADRELERELRRRLGGEELSDEEKAQIAELDREIANAAQRRSDPDPGRKEVR